MAPRGVGGLGLMLGLLAACGPDLPEAPAARRQEPLTSQYRDGVSNYTGTRDSFLDEAQPDQVGGDSAELAVLGAAGRRRVVLMSWDLRSVPARSLVQNAEVRLSLNDASAASMEVGLVRRAWQEGAVTWNQAGPGAPWQVPGGLGPLDVESAGVALSCPNGSVCAVVLPQGWVQDWVDSEATNFGIQLAFTTASGDELKVASRERLAVAERPALNVTWLLADGGEPDAGATDAGATDGGGAPQVDGGPPSGGAAPLFFAVGCVAQPSALPGLGAALLLAGALLLRRRSTW